MELIRKDITLDKKIIREASQILVEGDIIVPDIKPDIDTILEVTANAYIDSKEISNEKVNFKGNLDLHILYIAKGEAKPIYSMETVVPINDFINIDGIDKNMSVFTTCIITNIDHKIINDRKVNFRAIIEVCAEVFSKDRFEIITDVQDLPEGQMKKKDVNFNKIICSKFDRFNIKNEVEVPSGYPNIGEILQCNISFNNKDIKVSTNKINVAGEFKACVLYKRADGDGIIEYFEQNLPFSEDIDADGALDNMDAEVNLDIQEKNIQICDDADGEPRKIGLEAYIGCNIKVSFEDELKILEDAYMLDQNLELTRNNVNYHKLVCKNKNQVPFKEVIKIEENLPAILQIIKINGKAILDEVKIIEDKVIVEGIIDCNILYITNDNEVPMNCYNALLPYQQVIETKGAYFDSIAEINSNLEHIGVNMLSDKEVEIRGLLNFDACIMNKVEIGFITEIIFEELDKDFLNNIGSMTIYVVQKGDTLWNLAKRFNTTVQDIVEINEIENPDLIYPGEKLLILKRVC